MANRVKRKAAVEAAVEASGKTRVNPNVVVAILLSLIECGRVPTMRFNAEGEAIQTSKASPSIRFTLPWTGAGNAMSLPQGQTLVYLTRDPTNCMMYYDYNNGGAAGVAQTGAYQWASSSNVPDFTLLSANTNILRPLWAINNASQKAFHGTKLYSKTFGDRVYMHCDAPPNNAVAATSNVTVSLPGGQPGVQVGDIFELGFFRFAEGIDILVSSVVVTLAGVGAQNLAVFVVPFTDKYRVQLNWTSLNAGFTTCNVRVQQNWACGTLCCNALPQLETIWQNLQRVRILGANIDMINVTPEQYRGGSVVPTQLAAGTTEYYPLQGQIDPFAWIGAMRGVESRDMGKGVFTFIKPDGGTAFGWKRPFTFDGSGNVVWAKGPALIENGFIAIAVSAPDLVAGGSTTTTRGQVTLDFRFSVEIDSKFNWLDFGSPVASIEDWDAAEKAIAHIPQFWDDPNWGKIWQAIKGGARIASNILSVIPDPRAQAIGRVGNQIVDVLN